MSANLASTVGALLSMVLVGSAGPSQVAKTPSPPGYVVASMQSQLQMLDLYSGSVTGRVSPEFLTALARYVTMCGRQTEWVNALAASTASTHYSPSSAPGSVDVAMERDLATLWLYQGPIQGHWSMELGQSLRRFDAEVGLPTRTLTAPKTLSQLAHWTSVAITARHHWPYRVKPGDTPKLLAWVGGISQSTFLNANRILSGQLSLGQAVVWNTRTKTVRKGQPTVRHTRQITPNPSASSTSPGTVGVLANIQPVADLVLLHPDAFDVSSLIRAQSLRNTGVNVAVTGSWALTHQELMQKMARRAIPIAVTGYSGVDLNTLPKAGVVKELTWAVDAVKQVAGLTPGFAVLGAKPNATVLSVCRTHGLTVLTPTVMVKPLASSVDETAAVTRTLLTHPNEMVGVTQTLDFKALFGTLFAHHFIYETYSQTWAGE